MKMQINFRDLNQKEKCFCKNFLSLETIMKNDIAKMLKPKGKMKMQKCLFFWNQKEKCSANRKNAFAKTCKNKKPLIYA